MIRAVSLTLDMIAAPAVIFVGLSGDDAPSDGGSGRLVIPNLSISAHEGREHFAASCGACHGAYGEGSDSGPVLIHTLYGRTLYRDAEIVSAVRNGARARNWPFGDMPAIGGVSDDRLDLIIGFLREVQAANNIE
ncbi:MAG: cytochrome c [Pseudomonadota bacterium]